MTIASRHSPRSAPVSSAIVSAAGTTTQPRWLSDGRWPSSNSSMWASVPLARAESSTRWPPARPTVVVLPEEPRKRVSSRIRRPAVVLVAPTMHPTVSRSASRARSRTFAGRTGRGFATYSPSARAIGRLVSLASTRPPALRRRSCKPYLTADRNLFTVIRQQLRGGRSPTSAAVGRANAAVFDRPSRRRRRPPDKETQLMDRRLMLLFLVAG